MKQHLQETHTGKNHTLKQLLSFSELFPSGVHVFHRVESAGHVQSRLRPTRFGFHLKTFSRPLGGLAHVYFNRHGAFSQVKQPHLDQSLPDGLDSVPIFRCQLMRF